VVDGASVFGGAAGSPVGAPRGGGELERGGRGADRDSSRGTRVDKRSNGADAVLLCFLRTNRTTTRFAGPIWGYNCGKLMCKARGRVPVYIFVLN